MIKASPGAPAAGLTPTNQQHLDQQQAEQSAIAETKEREETTTTLVTMTPMEDLEEEKHKPTNSKSVRRALFQDEHEDAKKQKVTVEPAAAEKRKTRNTGKKKEI